MAELDASVHRPELARERRARQPFVRVEHGSHPLEADGRLRDVGAGAREILDRPEQLAEIRDEDDQRAGRHRVGEHQPRAEPQHRGGAERHQAGDDRAEQRADPPRVERRLHAFQALGAEPLALERAPRERLHDADGAEPLLNDGDELALAAAHVVGRS